MEKESLLKEIDHRVKNNFLRGIATFSYVFMGKLSHYDSKRAPTTN